MPVSGRQNTRLDKFGNGNLLMHKHCAAAPERPVFASFFRQNAVTLVQSFDFIEKSAMTRKSSQLLKCP
jgi:hypothetical protein